MNVGAKQQTSEGTGLYGQTTAKRNGSAELGINGRETYMIVIGREIVGIVGETCFEVRTTCREIPVVFGIKTCSGIVTVVSLVCHRGQVSDFVVMDVGEHIANVIILPLGTQPEVVFVEMELHDRIIDGMIIEGSVAHLVSPVIQADVIVAILV